MKLPSSLALAVNRSTATDHSHPFAPKSLSFPNLKTAALQNISRETLITQFNHLRGVHSSRGVGDDESRFLNTWKESLSPERWGAYLLSWARALATLGTPLSFTEGTTYQGSTFTIGELSYPSIVVRGGNAYKKAELMELQKSYEGRIAHLHYRFEKYCSLCGNIRQNLESKLLPNEIQDCSMADLGEYLVLPDRYPTHPGEALFVPKNHHGANGNAITNSYLTNLMWLCDLMGLIALRNPIVDVGGVTEHEHAHLIPQDLLPSGFISSIVGTVTLSTTAARIVAPTGTPFATLVIAGTSPNEIAAVATPLINRMEHEGVTFTLAYAEGNLFISPRFAKSDSDIHVTIGATLPLHLIDVERGGMMKAIERQVPYRGEFEWSSLLD